MNTEANCIQVAVMIPLRRIFSYAPPPEGHLQPGMRVRVPFGKGSRIGIVLGYASCPPDVTLKTIEQVLDAHPILPVALQQLIEFGAEYYHHPLGDAWATALPTLLRQGRPLPKPAPWGYRLSATEAQTAPRQPGKLQQALRELLVTTSVVPEAEIPKELRHILRQAIRRGWIETVMETISPEQAAPSPHRLNAEQESAVSQLRMAGGFNVWLLEGVTGSGKTEVYLEAIRPHLESGAQALILVPEIGLTPQLVERCQTRFGEHRVAALHSAQGDGERLRIWAAAAAGQIQVIVGTRSALFVPLPRLAMIIVDEEHDPSFKQQNGWHYSARDLAIQRARLENVPIVLGSATPSLESLYNTQKGRYRLLELRQRATSADLPKMTIVPLRRENLQGGISSTLLTACRETLEAGNQVLLFLNRRGYAPAVLCHDCGHVVQCPRCSAPMTWHRQQERLRCHHCSHESRWPQVCPACRSAALITAGQGTEQLEEVLRQRFPQTPIWRIDRDALHGRDALATVVANIRRNRAAILVGTQMLAKGHHFPAVTLVGIINTDQGLFSADFRAPERLLQTVLQVAGRAGRAERPGQVLLQTHLPEHPLLQSLAQGDYRPPAQALLDERRAAGLPPFGALTLLRAEAHQRCRVDEFLRAACQCAPPAPVEISGPTPSLMERRAGFERAELWIQAPSRAQMQKALKLWLPRFAELQSARNVRWMLDVDPLLIT
ncbi:primosomal protein N' [Acidithiobacillus sp.]|uniref:primosomal protein N' n=1 Tax=Acidithiobacillus sp. TaxID=1872118 RepID=UPI0025C29137|nr:primosomal protein N' [Acidithiobacillus sp.]